jgi:nitroimidazol reductase NimA-like FMN-containing flavoprotein (pyridoxamine 5'-phosphate oxidase superfamily)
MEEASERGAPVNRRRQIRMNAEELTAFLRANGKASLATLDRYGFPHVVAMGYFFADGAFFMTSYAKAQKVLNIRRNPQVGLMVETGDAYAQLRGVTVRGTCEIIEETEAVRAAMLRRRGAGFRPPRAGVDSAPKRVLLKVTPHKIASWDHAKLGGRY